MFMITFIEIQCRKSFGISIIESKQCFDKKKVNLYIHFSLFFI